MGGRHRSARDTRRAGRLISVLRLVVVFAQLVSSQTVAPDTGAYSSEALRGMIAMAADSNRAPPSSLRGYHSRIETETALIIRDTLGREHSAEIEQIASEGRWWRNGRYELHIIGYRSQNIGVPYSTMTIIRGWTVPTLYGERLSLGAYFTAANRNDTIVAVHPFAADRERFYRFSGGDTVTVLRIGSRNVPIARVRVTPNVHSDTRWGVFDGEIDLDADRHQIVRMRGRFHAAGGERARSDRLARLTGIAGAAYVEFVNAEVGGKYWLPASQRTEFQVSFPLLGQARPVFRIVSTIRDIVVNDSAGMDSSSDSRRVIVSWAQGDSASRFDGWSRELGAQSGSVHADDFADMAPEAWRVDGPPRLNLFSTRASKYIRFNRVEGLFLGLEPSVDFRSLAPGLSAGVSSGWAFSEQTARGGAHVSLRRGRQLATLRAERTLESTNDFTLPLSDDPGFGAAISSVDNYDYVDRRALSLSLTSIIGNAETAISSVQLGIGSDHAEASRLHHGLFATRGFEPNRGASSGSYAKAAADFEWHPSVTGDFLRPGVGARLHYEVAGGDLAWQRIEAGLAARRHLGNLSLVMHTDAGAAFGNALPPQVLFELGGTESLPGYSYKEFVGDRAVVFRSFASYRLGLWERPIHVGRTLMLPGFSPGLVTSIEGGWSGLSSDASRRAALVLGTTDAGEPVSRPTDRIRSTFGAGLSLFGDLLHVGAARPLDHNAPWRLSVGFGALF
jgi:hypothetical protein